MAGVTRPSSPRVPDGGPSALLNRDRTRVAVFVAATNFVLFALMSLTAWVAWGGMEEAIASGRGALAVVGQGMVLTLTNLLFGVAVIVGTFAFRPLSHRWPARVATCLGVAAVLAVPRMLVLRSIESTPSSGAYAAATWALGLAAGSVGMLAALFSATLVDRARREAHQREEEAGRAARAVAELQEEEMRVRRMVSDQLHGTLQFRIVAVTAGLDQVAAELDAAGQTATAKELRRWAETLDEIREAEVRALSHSVFPSGVDLSTRQAIETLLRRLPPQITSSVELGPGYRRLVAEHGAPVPIPERLVAVYTVEEAATNALKHGRATSIVVRADVLPTPDPDRFVFDVIVDDDGTGPAEATPALRGLARHAERLRIRGGTLELLRNDAGGARLHFTLPFDLVRDDPGA